MGRNSADEMFKKPFSFEGRIRRAEYFISFVFYFFVWGFLYMSLLLFGKVAYFLFIIEIPISWFIVAQGAKRCHDLGNSGFFQYVPFYHLFLLFAQGDSGENEYGRNPKEIL